MGLKKISKLVCVFAAVTAMMGVITGCGSNSAKSQNEVAEPKNLITVGFSQLGAESDWRSSNTLSMQSAFTEADGYNLIYKNGQQKQANQITAIRMFIQQGVDYIVLAPVTERGWDSVLNEAKDAGIPVIVVDRKVDVENENLYSCWVGSDFELEGKKMAEWINAFTSSIRLSGEDIHIVNIQGTIGSTAQIGRTKGLTEAAEKYGWDLKGQMSGDFTEAKGKEVMATFLKLYDDINIVYCENDNEAIGAIEAIESIGRHVGWNIKHGDIMVVSFDGINKEALEYAKNGKISCIAECNPMHGPRVKALIDALVAGETPDKQNYVDERIFSSLRNVRKITVDGIDYEIEDIED